MVCDLNTARTKGLESGNININAPCMAKIPPASILKQLAVAVEYGKNYKSVKDLALSRDSSPERERASLSFSAVKSLMLREKDEKSNFECGNDDETFLLIQSLFDAEDYFCRWKNASGSATPTVASLPRYFHTAPSETFVTRLSEVMGRFNTLQKMVSFWCRVVDELRRRWTEGQPVPGMPLDESPDLNSCLLHQQLQVINCCLSRKHHRIIATRSLDSVTRVASPNSEESFVSHDMVSSSPIMYARINSGNLVLRLGADHCSKKNLTLLETGESIFSPVTQEGPVLTEELIRETEEFVMQTGSLGAGCSQLLSDMQAFKAANPGCILEDFVRWYSPADWIETERSNETKDSFDGGDPSSKRGQLSSRMQKEGNLWRELWKNAKPLPAAKQTPLFDEDLAVEGILNTLEDIQPADLFKQLFASLLGSGFIIAETTLAKNSNLSKVFYECKDYTIAMFQGDTWTDNIDDLCQVYETVETMLIHPEDSHRIMSEEPIATGEPRRLFKKFNLNFGSKDRREKSSKDWKKSEENPTFQMFSDLFDGKSSLFTKKPPRPSSTSQADVPPICR
ncbi:PREDICTED: rab3 GTPase-activating protein catalytic subunit-like isoform X2 [Nelumbo nucifera]|uniref:Rab3 GTPase-activating protein catalytic subunit-like isoform X2 n=1 Tax=Nelumbo nucifera TaxID=4432 RepID=A0A1U8BBH3_NELNU|nr:PREDICTED: rab3 GTPase-activating protein catalytic subunit-like isoform X2 [Nelumbo nucifera]